MKSNSAKRPTTQDLTPLLRSIAEELITRTMAIVETESRIRVLQSGAAADSGELPSLVAALANHRRELRYVDKELEQLGWKRDRERPMRFVATDRETEDVDTWQLQGTGFYNSLDVPRDV